MLIHNFLSFIIQISFIICKHTWVIYAKQRDMECQDFLGLYYGSCGIRLAFREFIHLRSPFYKSEDVSRDCFASLTMTPMQPKVAQQMPRGQKVDGRKRFFAALRMTKRLVKRETEINAWCIVVPCELA